MLAAPNLPDDKQREILPTRIIAAYTAYALSTAVFVLVAIWMIYYDGGLAWQYGDGAVDKLFNIHPFVMSLGPVMLATWSALAYRITPVEKPWTKMAHGWINVCVLICIGVGLAAEICDKSNGGAVQYNSLHTWIGMTTICIFALQAVAGITLYAFKLGTDELRVRAKPFHAGVGAAAVLCACASAVTGMSITQGDDSNNYPDITPKDFHYMIGNVAGLLCMFTALCVGYVLLSPSPSLYSAPMQARQSETEAIALKTDYTSPQPAPYANNAYDTNMNTPVVSQLSTPMSGVRPIDTGTHSNAYATVDSV